MALSEFDPLSLSQLANLVHQCLRSEKPFRRISSKNRQQLSWDVAFVASGMRTGCLIDLISVGKPMESFTALLLQLRSKHASFYCLKHVFEPYTNQSFIVNDLLLQTKRLNSLYFVDVTPDKESPVLLRQPPGQLDTVVAQLQLSLTQPDVSVQLSLLEQETNLAIPLAAFIIDYQVAYVLGSISPGSAVLSNVPLDVYQCEVDGHILMKFSCPVNLGVDYPGEVGPMAIVERLENVLSKKAKDDSRRQIMHSTVTHDRVAL